MFREEWEMLSAREKHIVFAVVLTAITIINIAFAVELLRVMKFTGILDHIMEMSDTAMVQVCQNVCQTLTW